MTNSVKEFITKYGLEKNMLFENSNWVVSLRPEQKTPFSLIISIKSDVYKISDLTKKQNLELFECYSFIEDLAFNKLNANNINYLCLMMIDSIVHFHVFPRFRNGFSFDKYVLEDKYFPKPVDLTDGFSFDFRFFKANTLDFINILG